MPDYTVLTGKDISQQTYFLREREWFDNLAENLPLIRRGSNVLDLKGTRKGRCAVVGAGPSLDKFGHLELLKEHKGPILACDKELIPLLERGIMPDFVVSVDGSPKIGDFYDSPLVERYSDRVSAIFSHQVHPSVAKYPGKKYWFSVLMDDPNGKMSISRAIYWLTKNKTMAQSYGNVGGFTWGFAEFLGYQTIVLLGIDFSYGPDVQPMQTLYWRGFLDIEKGVVQSALKHYKKVDNPFGHKVVTDDVWEAYREILHHGIKATPAKTVNCSPYTTVFGDRVSCLDAKEALGLR